jgi:hypothetical protein
MKYKVKAGRRFGASRQYGPGDIVELTPLEAESFLDTLTLVEEAAPPGLQNVAQVQVPEEMKLFHSVPEVEEEEVEVEEETGPGFKLQEDPIPEIPAEKPKTVRRPRKKGA